ncbi:hypothetical protein [Dyella terrae]|uniref:hypothetical protein n=1 Tax=Dyella terrae TaxID=522259 RepID=UPI001EFD3B6C|nr:hypothetical protein [Dyella terrae]
MDKEQGMRLRTFVCVALGVLVMQGVSAPARAASSVQLFGDDGSPRFSFYLACVSKTVNCEIIERMFGRWADDRSLSVHTVTPEEAARLPENPEQAQVDGGPYRVTVRYAPEMVSVSNSLVSASKGPPLVSYVANVRVFDSVSGKLIKSMTWRKEEMADRDQGGANPYLDAQVHDFLKHLDPGYAKSPAS